MYIIRASVFYFSSFISQNQKLDGSRIGASIEFSGKDSLKFGPRATRHALNTFSPRSLCCTCWPTCSSCSKQMQRSSSANGCRDMKGLTRLEATGGDKRTIPGQYCMDSEILLLPVMESDCITFQRKLNKFWDSFLLIYRIQRYSLQDPYELVLTTAPVKWLAGWV